MNGRGKPLFKHPHTHRRYLHVASPRDSVIRRKCSEYHAVMQNRSQPSMPDVAKMSSHSVSVGSAHNVGAVCSSDWCRVVSVMRMRTSSRLIILARRKWISRRFHKCNISFATHLVNRAADIYRTFEQPVLLSREATVNEILAVVGLTYLLFILSASRITLQLVTYTCQGESLWT